MAAARSCGSRGTPSATTARNVRIRSATAADGVIAHPIRDDACPVILDSVKSATVELEYATGRSMPTKCGQKYAWSASTLTSHASSAAAARPGSAAVRSWPSGLLGVVTSSMRRQPAAPDSGGGSSVAPCHSKARTRRRTPARHTLHRTAARPTLSRLPSPSSASAPLASAASANSAAEMSSVDPMPTTMWRSRITALPTRSCSARIDRSSRGCCRS